MYARSIQIKRIEKEELKMKGGTAERRETENKSNKRTTKGSNKRDG